MKTSYIYILTNKYRTTFYIGVTANLSKRLEEHYDEKASLFTKKYNIKDLIYFKEWKLNLIKSTKPTLKTLDY